MRTILKRVHATVLALGMGAIATVASAQTTDPVVRDTTRPTDTTRTTTTNNRTDDDRGFNWGWLGLAGLIGLVGLMPRNNNRNNNGYNTGTTGTTGTRREI